MDVCVLTGVESEGSVSLARILVEKGFRVYGLASEKRDWGFAHMDFIPLECPQQDISQTEAILQAILDHEKSISAVVHLAHAFSAQSFQELSAEQLSSQVQRNLTLPLLVNRMLLPGVIQARGHLLQCCLPIGRGPRVGGTLYLALEDGLQRFYRRLYEEVRSKGVRVTCIRPVGVLGNSHDQETTVISGEFLAESIAGVLLQQGGGFFADLEIRPEPQDSSATTARPAQPVSLSSMRLPPALEKDQHKRSFTLPARKSNAPKKKLEWADRPIDYGPAPEMDDDDEDDEEEESFVSQKSDRQVTHGSAADATDRPARNVQPAEGTGDKQQSARQEGDSDGRKRRRRRRRRGRHREEGQNGTVPAASAEKASGEPESKDVSAKGPEARQPAAERKDSQQQPAAAGAESDRKASRSNRNRKRRPLPQDRKPFEEKSSAVQEKMEQPKPVNTLRQSPLDAAKRPQAEAPAIAKSAAPVSASPVKRAVRRKESTDKGASIKPAEESKEAPVKKVAKKRTPRKKAASESPESGS